MPHPSPAGRREEFREREGELPRLPQAGEPQGEESGDSVEFHDEGEVEGQGEEGYGGARLACGRGCVGGERGGQVSVAF